VAVSKEDGDRAARRLQERMRGELAHLRGRGAWFVADVHRVRVAIEIDAVGVDDDQLRPAL